MAVSLWSILNFNQLRWSSLLFKPWVFDCLLSCSGQSHIIILNCIYWFWVLMHWIVVHCTTFEIGCDLFINLLLRIHALFRMSIWMCCEIDPTLITLHELRSAFCEIGAKFFTFFNCYQIWNEKFALILHDIIIGEVDRWNRQKPLKWSYLWVFVYLAQLI